MTILAIICTFGVYSFYVIEAIKAYKRGEVEPRPKGGRITTTKCR